MQGVVEIRLAFAIFSRAPIVERDKHQCRGTTIASIVGKHCCFRRTIDIPLIEPLQRVDRDDVQTGICCQDPDLGCRGPVENGVACEIVADFDVSDPDILCQG